MSFARGFIKGFVGQSLDNKAAADQRLAEFTDKISVDYLNNKLPKFLKNEKDQEDRFKLIEKTMGKPAAMYASASGLNDTVDGANMILSLKGEKRSKFLDTVNKIDFMNYDRNMNAQTRTADFNERHSATTDYLKKIPGGLPNAVTDLMIPKVSGDMPQSQFDATTLQPLDTIIGATTDASGMKNFVPKEDRSDLRTFVTFFNSNIADPNLGGYENITKNYPSLTVADDPTITYQDLKDVGYNKSELDFAREKYIKQNFAKPAYNVNYKTDYEEFENKVKERRLLSKNIRKDLDLPQTISDPKDLAKTKSEAFAFGDVATTESVKYTEDLDAINISLSNAISKILADVSLDEETKNSAIERIKIAAANKKKELGPAPTTTTTGPLIP